MTTSLLERLNQRLPGQSLDEVLIEQAVEMAEPPVAAALEAAAVPIVFDANILGTLLNSTADAQHLVDTLVHDYSFISFANGHYVYYEPARRTILLKLARDQLAKFQSLNAEAARYFQNQANTEPPGERYDTYIRNTMYHLLASNAQDEDDGYRMLLALFDQAEANYQPGEAYILIRLADEQRDYLTAEHQAGLVWLQGRLARLQGHAREAARVLGQGLDSNPPGGLGAQMALSLAAALGDDEQWSDAILHAHAAYQAFRNTHQTFDEARSLIELARSHAGLAHSVRGSPAVRPPVNNPALNTLYQAALLIERIPILAYLMVRLGMLRILPVLSSVARDQDWIVARLFGKAAMFLRQAEHLLGVSDGIARSGGEKDSAPRAAAEEVRIEARQAYARLYRILGHPSYAVTLLTGLLEHRLILQNEYHMARVRLELAEALDDAGQPVLATEELRAAIPTLHSVQDLADEARAHLRMGTAIVSLKHTWSVSRADRLLIATQELKRSLDLYTQLQDDNARAEVARILDRVASDASVPPDHSARQMAREAAATVSERRFAVRYAQARIQQFRTGALLGLVVTFLLLLFLFVRTESSTQVGAVSLIRGGILEINAPGKTSVLTLQRFDQRLSPVAVLTFPAGLVLRTLLGGLFTYLFAYLILGLGLIRVTSAPALRDARRRFFAIDRERIRSCSDGNEPDRAIRWQAIQEAIQVDRNLFERPIASYSHLVLYSDDSALDVPGRTVNYEDELVTRIREHLPEKPRALGFSMLKSWLGALFLLTFTAQLAFLIASALDGGIALHPVLGPYALSNLFVYSYLGLLVPLAWWLVVNPLRESLILHPEREWPLLLGPLGLALEAAVLLQLRFTAVLPRPDVYPAAIGAFLLAASAVFVWQARYWQGHPSLRGKPIYPALVRFGALAVAVLAFVAALLYGTHEVRAYHALMLGNQMRDQAIANSDPVQAQKQAQEAINYYTEAIAFSPASPDAYASRGALHSSEGDYQGAIADDSKAIALHGSNATVYANRAAAYQGLAHQVVSPTTIHVVFAGTEPKLEPLVLDSLQQALHDYQQAVNLDPSQASYHVQSGTVLHDLHQYQDAIGEYTHALMLDPNNSDAYTGRGWANFQNAKNNQKAGSPAQAAQGYLNAWADFNKADTLLSNLLQSQNLPNSATARLQLERQRANNVNGLAWSTLNLGQGEFALTLFQLAHDLDPENGWYDIALGGVNWFVSIDARGNVEKYRPLIEKAVAAYERGTPRMDEPSVQAYLYRTLGQLHYILSSQPGHDPRQELEAAIHSDDLAILDDATDPDYFRLRGTIHQELAYALRAKDWPAAVQHYNASIQDLSHVIQMDSASPSQVNDARSTRLVAYNQLAWGYHLNGDDTQALAETQQALMVNSNDGLALFNLAVLHLYTGQIDQARLDYRHAIAVVRTLDAASAKLRYDDAVQDLNDFKTKHPELANVADEMLKLITEARAAHS